VKDGCPPDLSICAPRFAPNRHRHKLDLKSHFSRLKLSIYESVNSVILILIFRKLDLKLAMKMLGGEGGRKSRLEIIQQFQMF
jgi:hypothetical protein